MRGVEQNKQDIGFADTALGVSATAVSTFKVSAQKGLF